MSTRSRAGLPGPAAAPDRLPGKPWGLDEAAEFLGVCRRHLVRLADQDKIKTVRLGARRLVPDEEMQRITREGC